MGVYVCVRVSTHDCVFPCLQNPPWGVSGDERSGCAAGLGLCAASGEAGQQLAGRGVRLRLCVFLAAPHGHVASP